MNTPRVQRGWTLLELLLVLTLLATAATLLGLRPERATRSAQLRGATTELEQALRSARLRAAAQHTSAWVVLAPGTNAYRLVLDGDPADARRAWHTLGAVQIRAAGWVTENGVEPIAHELAIRVSAAGVTLPWAAELEAGTVARVVYSDGLEHRLKVHDDATLATFDPFGDDR